MKKLKDKIIEKSKKNQSLTDFVNCFFDRHELLFRQLLSVTAFLKEKELIKEYGEWCNKKCRKE